MEPILCSTEGDYALQSAIGSVDPQWTWYFPDSPSTTWLATTLALNPPLHLAFSEQPGPALPLVPMLPGIQVTVRDAFGNRATTFNGPVTVVIGRNGGVLMPGTLYGTKTVRAVNGVATFADLSIDQPGSGYTLVASGTDVTGAESASFNVGMM